MKRLLPFAIALLALTGCVNREAQDKAKQTEAIVKDPTVPVETSLIVLEVVPETVEVTGQLVAAEETQVGPTVPGKLISVFVREGQSINAGQAIAQQDTDAAREALRQAQAQESSARAALRTAQNNARINPDRRAAAIRAAEARVEQARQALAKIRAGSREQEIAQAEANVERTQSDLNLARKAADRARDLYREGAIAEQDLEQAENRLDNALAAYEQALAQLSLAREGARVEDIRIAQEDLKAAEEALRIERANKRGDVNLDVAVDSARSQLRAAESSVRLAQDNLSELTIRAPFSGRISGTPLKAGTVVSPGVPVARIIGNQGLQFVAEVPETNVAKINIGARVTIRVDALPDTELSGTVLSIDPKASGVARTFSVRIGFNESMEKLKAGMFARGEIDVDATEEVALIPSQAVIRDGDKSYVFLVEDGKAVRTDITAGRALDGQLPVSGLRNGAELVVVGQAQLRDGAEVSLDEGLDEPDSEEAEGE